MIKTVFSTFFLSLRKLVLYLLGIVLAIGLLVYFIANSPWVIKKAIDAFAPDYNITYSRIYGNALTGVKIDDIKFNNELLAKNASLQWNPDDLLKKKIVINHINLEQVNVDTIKGLLSAFSSDSNESSSSSFAFDVGVTETSITIAPFVEEGIRFNNIDLRAKDIVYSNEKISLKKLDLRIDSNITKVVLNANMKKSILEIDSLNIQNLDVLALEGLIFDNEQENIPLDKSDNIVDGKPNRLMPSMVKIQKLNVSILPIHYDSIDINKLIFTMKNGIYDTTASVLKEADIELETETNLAKAVHTGQIKDNQLIGILKLTAEDTLFTQYNLPLNPESIGELDIHLDASKERVIANIDTNMTQVLKVKKGAFNVDINSLLSTLIYTINEGTLKVDTKADIGTTYTKNMIFTNLFKMDDNITYSGDLWVKEIIGIDSKYVKPINDLKMEYHGDDKSIKSVMHTNMLVGEFISNDFKTARLHLESKEPLLLRDYLVLPKELNTSKASLSIDAPLDFESNASYLATVKIDSNLANIDANMSYKNVLTVVSSVDIPEKSLLRPYSKALKWDNISPIKVKTIVTKNNVNVEFNARSLKANVQYDLNTTNTEGKIHLGGLEATLSGIAKKEMKIHSSITSMPLLLQSVSEIYDIGEIPKIEGALDITAQVNALSSIDLQLKSPQIIYHSDHKTSQVIDDIDMLLHLQQDKIVLKQYKLNYDKEKIFATKPSTVMFKDNVISISPLWINDNLKAEGSYDLETKKGEIVAGAQKFHLEHEIIDLDTNIDLKTVLDGNSTTIKGKIILLGGDIHYDLSQKTFASDDDIIIVQDMKKEKSSSFMDNLVADIQIKTKKPLVYNKGDINIKADVDLSVHKVAHSELLVLGSVKLLEGGSYTFKNKKFVLEKSFIYFTGNPNKPLLEINVKYKALKHLVKVRITGTADMPNISFSSKPSLSEEQILSLILFDSEEGAGTNSGDEMMKMMGGAIAKSALNNMGIKLDHLVLGEGNSIEVGKKLTKKITIIYINDVIPKVKLKYEHNPHTESVIGVSEESQSYDIIYKNDF